MRFIPPKVQLHFTFARTYWLLRALFSSPCHLNQAPLAASTSRSSFTSRSFPQGPCLLNEYPTLSQ